MVLAATAGVAQGPAGGFVFAPGVGERVVVQQWTTADGLPIAGLTSVLLGEDGLLWIGTFDGLVSFDGLRFERFDSVSTPELGGNRIVDLVRATPGSFWVVTEQGDIALYRNGAFEAVDTTALSHAGGRALAAVEAWGSSLAVGTAKGVLAATTERLTMTPVAVGVGDVKVLTVSDDGVLWAGGSRGVVVIGPNGSSSVGADRGVEAEVVGIAHDAAGLAWVATKSGILRQRRAGELSFEPAAALPHGADGLTGQLVWAPDGGLWIKMRGLTRLGPEGIRIVRRQEQPALDRTFQLEKRDRDWWIHDGRSLLRSGQRFLDVAEPRNDIAAVAVDPGGTVYVATSREGLYAVRPARIASIGPREGMARDVYPLVEDREGALWIGSMGSGLWRWKDGLVEAFGTERGLGERMVRALHLDRQGRVVIGTGRRLLLWDGQRLQQELGYEPAPDTHVLSIADDQSGRLVVGTNRGVWIRTAGQWRVLRLDDGLPSEVIRAAVVDEVTGDVWLGTDGGLVRVGADATLEVIGAGELLPSRLIRALTLGEGRTLWVGTQDRGLVRVDLSRRHFTTMSRRQGLFDDGIHALVEDGVGGLWISSNRGIARLDLAEIERFAAGEVAEVSCVVYDTHDGMLDREANGGSQRTGLRLRDGRLAFATAQGVVLVPTAEVSRGRLAPEPLIIAVRAAGEVLPIDDGRVVVEPHQRRFTIGLSARNARSPRWVRFRYRLQGEDDGWVEAGAERAAQYSGLSGGTYRFEATVRDADGIWSPQSAVLEIRLVPTFTETAVYRAALVVLVIGALWALERFVNRRRVQAAAALRRLVDQRTAELARQRDAAQEARVMVEQQARRLERLDRMKSELYANLSHELRTPLTVTIAALDDAEVVHGRPGDRLGRDLEVARRGARTLSTHIEELLELALAESGRSEVHPRQVEIRKLFCEGVRAFVPWAEREGVELVFTPPEAEMNVVIDPRVFDLVLQNLVSNALKFTPAGRRVVVALDVLATAIELRVSDEGHGIELADRERIFERFWRADDARVRERPGSGIGLPLARDLVRLHGGDLVLEHSSEHGSVFLARLSLAEPGHAPAGERPADPSAEVFTQAVTEPELDEARGDGARPTVLVIDDHPDLRALLRQALEADYEVLEARDGRQGLERIRTDYPDVVISDVMMPNLDGAALCRAVRSDPAIESTCLIQLSARADRSDVRAGLAAGADDYIVKPFDAAEVRLRIANHLESRRRLARHLLAATEGAKPPAVAASVVPAWRERLDRAIEAGLGNADFGVEALAQAVAMDRTTLFRQLAELGEPAPSQLLRDRRMQRAAELLADGAGVSQTAYAVGFRSVSHFSKAYRAAHGHSPSRRAPSP